MGPKSAQRPGRVLRPLHGETDAEQVDPHEVARGAVAFTVAVMDRAFRRNGGWTLLDAVPLSEKEAAPAQAARSASAGQIPHVVFTCSSRLARRTSISSSSSTSPASPLRPLLLDLNRTYGIDQRPEQ